MNILYKVALSIVGFSNMYLLQANENSSIEKLPNIVLIMADDMGIECMNYYGNIEYKTPTIDNLASNGVRFDKCFSQPLCTPSRVKIMTGKYNFRNYEDFGWLNPNEITFGNLLKQAGYSTCIAGKWQLNGLNRDNPGNQDINRPHHFGFDEYCLWQLHHKRADGERYANPLITQNGRDLPRDENLYGPDIFSDYICDFIKRMSKTEATFFAYYPMNLIHDPFVPTPDSPEWIDPDRRYEDDTTYVKDMVAYLDKIILKIETALKENDVWENTILIFTSDNGTKQTVVSTTNRGNILGGKGKTIHTGNQVPMVVSWPKKIKNGIVMHNPIDFADILPTLADAAEIDPATYSTDGKSFFNLLQGEKYSPKQEVFIHFSSRWGTETLKYGRKSEHNRWVTNGIYKLYQDGHFYNCHNDPDEIYPLSRLNEVEQILQIKFDSILQQKEMEFPFNWNNEEFMYEKIEQSR